MASKARLAALAALCAAAGGVHAETYFIGPYRSDTERPTPQEACDANRQNSALSGTAAEAGVLVQDTGFTPARTQCRGASGSTLNAWHLRRGTDAAFVSWADYQALTAAPPPPAPTPAPTPAPAPSVPPSTVSCSGTCSVTITVDHVITWPDALTGLTGEKVAAYLQLWAAFLGAGVVVLGAKSLYNRFRVDQAH